MESGLFDAIQPAVPDIRDFQQVLQVAKDKDVGVICMKTGSALRGKRPELAKLGDPAKPFQTYFRYLLGLDGVTAIVSHVQNFDQMRENYSASGEPMKKSESRPCRSLAQALSTTGPSPAANATACRTACRRRHHASPMYAEDGDWYRSARTTVSCRVEANHRQWRGHPQSHRPYGLALSVELKQAQRWLA
jgi:hypothetical protein